jgi:hypothetical protein
MQTMMYVVTSLKYTLYQRSCYQMSPASSLELMQDNATYDPSQLVSYIGLASYVIREFRPHRLRGMVVHIGE